MLENSKFMSYHNVKMQNYLPLFIFILLSLNQGSAQAPKDLARSVPLWLETNSNGNNQLNWLPDDNAIQYEIYEVAQFSPYMLKTQIGQTDGQTNQFDLGTSTPGETKEYLVTKSSTTLSGVGLIKVGREIPIMHHRGRCLLVVNQLIMDSLSENISQHLEDLTLDGWEVSYQVVSDTLAVPVVKEKINQWYLPNYERSQSVFLLGHAPVPYSGNTAYDGHSNHYGAWAADTYYADMDGNWTDQSVNETSPTRPENDNVPGDGKFDQTYIPGGSVELEVGRVDFYNLPAFDASEIELTRRYLEKIHRYKMGRNPLPRRGLVENNFASFDEGFGQSAWRNFVPFFGGDQVMQGNYDIELDTAAYLWSYACGGGSYTSCGGVGTTANLWATKSLKTAFTMVFGSYFGDWDSKNNFLRSALACGDILTNAWSGRPIYQFWHMGLGHSIGFSTRFTMNANSGYMGLNYGANAAHIALMGDPTLRLYYPEPTGLVEAIFHEGDVDLNWYPSPDAKNGYAIYRKWESGNWETLDSFVQDTFYTDICITPGNYTYMVKAIRLEETGSGSFYNTSLGTSMQIWIPENEWFTQYFLDTDEDGYGNPDVDTIACVHPEGYVMNELDCNDANGDINPEAEEIPDNGIDEDCDGEDLVNTLYTNKKDAFHIFPNPVNLQLQIRTDFNMPMDFVLTTLQGKKVVSGPLTPSISLAELNPGIYWLKVYGVKGNLLTTKKVAIQR